MRLPLHKAAKIIHGDALEIDWHTVLNPKNNYDIIGLSFPIQELTFVLNSTRI